MTLWFENRFGDARQIARCDTTEDVYRSINDFINQANVGRKNPFKSYYIRTWKQDGKTWYDVGSHSEFFFTTNN